VSIEDEIERDRWGRPMLLNPETGRAEAFTRISTLSKAVDDQGGLIHWAAKQAVKGLIARPDLYEVARTKATDDKAMKEITTKARDAAASDAAANEGTTVHWWSEQLDTGRAELSQVPDTYYELLETYLKITSSLEVVEVELFVVNDSVHAAGTLDRLYRLPDGAVVTGDIKTGKWAPSYGAGAVAIQCSAYSGGMRYDPATGARSELHPDLDPSRNLLVHLPITGDTAPAVYELDGTMGQFGVKVANAVLAWRKERPVRPFSA
jgi:hypothetical protein